MRSLFFLALIALWTLAECSNCRAAERLPNILWIIADDLSPDLGCYGYEGVATPNIDRLAGEGVRYENAFATAPVCSSSRSALITGVYQTTTGTHHHRTTLKKPLPAPIQPITELLRGVGYFVCNSNATMQKRGKTDYNFAYEGALYDGVDWSTAPHGRQARQPFFAQVQINEPHRDFVPAKNPGRAADARIPVYYPEHPVVRRDWANYLETVEVLDAKVGAVLDRLDREGLADETIVFFFADHGRPHYRDKQWLYDGGIRVPLIIRSPGRIAPETERAELVSLLDVSAATLALAGVQIPPWMDGRDMLDAQFPGRDMILAARDRMGSTLDRVRCVRTSQFKYIRNFYPERPYSQHSGYKVLQYPGQTAAQALDLRGELTGPPAAFWADSRPTEELYDIAADPEELTNLSDNPEHAAAVTRLRRVLNEWIVQTDDQGRYREVGVEQTAAVSDAWYRQRMQRRGFATDYDPEQYLQWWEQELGLK